MILALIPRCGEQKSGQLRGSDVNLSFSVFSSGWGDKAPTYCNGALFFTFVSMLYLAFPLALAVMRLLQAVIQAEYRGWFALTVPTPRGAKDKQVSLTTKHIYLGWENALIPPKTPSFLLGSAKRWKVTDWGNINAFLPFSAIQIIQHGGQRITPALSKPSRWIDK